MVVVIDKRLSRYDLTQNIILFLHWVHSSDLQFNATIIVGMFLFLTNSPKFFVASSATVTGCRLIQVFLTGSIIFPFILFPMILPNTGGAIFFSV